MKSRWFLIFLLALLLASCAPSPSHQATPVVITAEVTKLVQITTTPLPQHTPTAIPTLERVYAEATDISRRIGTPIVANDECFQDDSLTQSGLNGCAATQLAEMEDQMAEIIKKLEEQYSKRRPPAEWQRFLNFQKEWEDFSQRECKFTSGSEIIDGVYKGGSMAPMNYGVCMVDKYESRLRELQVELFSFSDG